MKLTRELSYILTGALIVSGSVAAVRVSPLAASTLSAESTSTEKEDFVINSREDFQTFIENCRIDDWSRDRNVYLNCDLSADFSSTGFTGIPVFAGHFYGQGHTISNVTFTTSDKVLGLFRYLDKDGVIEDLTVYTSMNVTGAEAVLGGIVGVNAGTLRGCTFKGKIVNDGVTGGIVGQNGSTGVISGCNNDGYIISQYSVGGIAGRNWGIISSCTNTGSINADSSWLTDDSESSMSLDLSDLLATGTSLLTSGSDIGGIAGYSCGKIMSSTNSGKVGYPYNGKNVGGIAGRQSGRIISCHNTGDINGKQDVGGIVGQFEPFTTTEDHFNIKEYTDRLHDEIEKLINDAGDASDALTSDLSALLTHADSAQEIAGCMVDDVKYVVDADTDTLNDLSGRISSSIGYLDNIAGYVQSASADLTSIASMADACIDAVDAGLTMSSSDQATYNAAKATLKTAISQFTAYSGTMSSTLNELSADIDSAADVDAAAAATEISSDAESIAESISAEVTIPDITVPDVTIPDVTLPDTESITLPEGADITIPDVTIPDVTLPDVTVPDTTLPDAQSVSDSIKTDINNAKSDVNSALNNAGFSASKLNAVLEKGDELASSTSNLLNAATNIVSSVYTIVDTVTPYVTSLDGTLTTYLPQISGEANVLMGHVDSVTAECKSLTSYLSSLETLQFAKLPDDFDDNSASLKSEINSCMDILETINAGAGSYSDTIEQDLKDINDTVQDISDLVVDEYTEISGMLNGDDIIIDKSAEDPDNAKATTVVECDNSGMVKGNKNIGGIAGCMDRELDNDSDSTVTVKIGTKYIVYTTLTDCKNSGVILLNKSYGAGIVGYASCGYVKSCTDNGAVYGTAAKYLGGIAGYTDGTIDSCLSFTYIDGGSYVGGIAGTAEKVSSCCSFADTSDTSTRVGAIIGADETDSTEDISSFRENLGSTIYNNYYVSDRLYGIDGVSYEGIAQAVEYTKLKLTSSLSSKIRYFTVTFLDSDYHIIDSQSVRYGSDFDDVDMPTNRENGSYYTWTGNKAEKVTHNIWLVASEEKEVTVLASDLVTDSGRTFAYVEGSFTNSSALKITTSRKTPVSGESSDAYTFAISELSVTISKDAHVETGSSKAYTFTIENSSLGDTDTSVVRILNDSDGKLKIYRFDNGAWAQVKTTQNGSYLETEMTGTSADFCLVYEAASSTNYILIAGIIILIILLLIIIVVIIKSNKKRKTSAKTETPAEKKEENN